MRLFRLFLSVWSRLFWATFYIHSPENKSNSQRKESERDKRTARTSAPTTVVSNTVVTQSIASITSEPNLTTSNLKLALDPTTTTVTPVTTSKPMISPSLDDPRTGWIYKLRKEELQLIMRQFNVDESGKVEELRPRFAQFWREQAVQVGTPEDATNTTIMDRVFQTGQGETASASNITDGVYRLPSRFEITNPLGKVETSFSNYLSQKSGTREVTDISKIKEICNLPPDTKFEDVCRYLHDIEKKSRVVKPSMAERNHNLPLEYRQRDVPYQNVSHANQRDWQFPRGDGLVYSSDTQTTTQPTTRLYPQPGTVNPCQQTVTNTVNHNTDSICSLVRKWNVRFDGYKDPVLFLERLEELMESYRLDSSEVIKALPELLYGTALLWYRNVKETLDSYATFRQSFELQFLPPSYRRNLDEEIKRRTQGEHEPFRNFVVAINTLMRRRGDLSLAQRLDIIFSNMKPDYKLTVKRHEIFSVDELLRQAEHVESYWREKALFRPPPPPSMALVQETAYYSKNKSSNSYGSYSAGIVANAEVKKDTQRPPEKPSFFTKDKNRIDERPRVNNVYPKPEEQTSGKARPALVCWNCNKNGHLYRDCRLPKKLRCYRCKTEGVRTHDCKCQTQGNEQRTQEAGGNLSPK